MSAQVESWRVSTPEGVFETDLETLKQWIVEGCVSPNDKVSKGNLNWLEAGRVPMLREAFAAEVVPYQPLTPEVVTLRRRRRTSLPKKRRRDQWWCLPSLQ